MKRATLGKGATIVLLALTSIVATVASRRLSADNDEIAAYNEARGNQIVAALGRDKVANGAYPPTLGTLVPAYLPEIPPPRYARWIYLPDAGRQAFGLFFEGGDRDPVGVYQSDAGNWVVDTK